MSFLDRLNAKLAAVKTRRAQELLERCTGAAAAANEIHRKIDAMVTRASKAVASSHAAADAALQSLETGSSAARTYARTVAGQRAKEHDDAADVLRANALLLGALARVQDVRAIDAMFAALDSGYETAPAVALPLPLFTQTELPELETSLGVLVSCNVVDAVQTAQTLSGRGAVVHVLKSERRGVRNEAIWFRSLTAQKYVVENVEPEDVQLLVDADAAAVLEYAVTAHGNGTMRITYSVFPAAAAPKWFQLRASVLVLDVQVAELSIWCMDLTQQPSTPEEVTDMICGVRLTNMVHAMDVCIAMLLFYHAEPPPKLRLYYQNWVSAGAIRILFTGLKQVQFLRRNEPDIAAYLQAFVLLAGQCTLSQADHDQVSIALKWLQDFFRLDTSDKYTKLLRAFQIK